METKHTPGPWNCNRASAGGREIVVSEVSPVDIAVLSHRDKTQKEINANARLIAAAPDLLKALEYARDYLRGKNFDPGMRDGVAFVIEAAIAKAEGK